MTDKPQTNAPVAYMVRTGSYYQAFMLFVLLYLIGIVILYFAKPPTQKKNSADGGNRQENRKERPPRDPIDNGFHPRYLPHLQR